MRIYQQHIELAISVDSKNEVILLSIKLMIDGQGRESISLLSLSLSATVFLSFLWNKESTGVWCK